MPRFVGPGSGPLWVHDLFWLLIVVALVIGVILIVRTILDKPRVVPGSNWPARSGWPHQNPALQELDLRYARGEMDRTEYLQRRADLLGQPAPDIAGGKPPA